MNDVRHEVIGARWRKSSHSGSGDQCVEVAALASGTRAVRDSKDPNGPVLLFANAEWQGFVHQIKTGVRVLH